MERGNLQNPKWCVHQSGGCQAFAHSSSGSYMGLEDTSAGVSLDHPQGLNEGFAVGNQVVVIVQKRLVLEKLASVFPK